MDKSIHELGQEIDQITDRISQDASDWSYPRDEDISRLWEIAATLKNWKA